MAVPDEVVLLKSTLQMQNKWYSVKLTPSEIYWESLGADRVAGGPYSQPLVNNAYISSVNFGSPDQQHPCQMSIISDEPEIVCSQPHHFDDIHSLVVQPPIKRYHSACSSFFCCRVWNSSVPENVCSICKKPIKAENQVVKLADIITIRAGSGGSRDSTTDSHYKYSHGNIELVPVGSATSLCIHHIRRASGHKLRQYCIVFQSSDATVVTQWVERVTEILSWPEFGRPRSLLVFINPIAGRGRSVRTYREKVAPLLELARISTEVIVTEKKNHAQNILQEANLDQFDGILSVGGDGMFSEVVHGLLSNVLRASGLDQPSAETILPQLKWRIGIIPAGSTDTVSYSTQGVNDPTTAALHIIIGDSVAMDVATIYHGAQFVKYNISFLGYGFYGDCILDSEPNRWMGPKRYDWEGFKKVLSNRSYEGELSFLPSPNKESHTRDGVVCKAGCSVCQASAHHRHHISDTEAACQEGEQWQVVRGQFAAVNSFLISCRCRYSVDGPAPSAHLGDGCTDLVVIHRCSRLDYTKHLYRCSDPHSDQFDFPFIHTFRVSRFRFRPLSSFDDVLAGSDDLIESSSEVKISSERHLQDVANTASVWNCDGEVIDEPFIDFRVHPQTIRLFARGIDNESFDVSTTCLCCSSVSPSQ